VQCKNTHRYRFRRFCRCSMTFVCQSTMCDIAWYIFLKPIGITSRHLRHTFFIVEEKATRARLICAFDSAFKYALIRLRRRMTFLMTSEMFQRFEMFPHGDEEGVYTSCESTDDSCLNFTFEYNSTNSSGACYVVWISWQK